MQSNTVSISQSCPEQLHILEYLDAQDQQTRCAVLKDAMTCTHDQCLICGKYVTLDFLIKCPSACSLESANLHLCCMDCISRLSDIHYDATNDQLSYSCPCCRAKVVVKGISQYRVVQEFKSVFEHFDLAKLQGLIALKNDNRGDHAESLGYDYWRVIYQLCTDVLNYAVDQQMIHFLENNPFRDHHVEFLKCCLTECTFEDFKTVLKIMHQMEKKVDHKIWTSKLKPLYVNLFARPGSVLHIYQMLAQAAQLGYTQILQLFNDHAFTQLGFDINQIDSHGNTLLHIATRHGHLNFVDGLSIIPNLNPNIRNRMSQSPLDIAANEGFLAIFVRLTQFPAIDLDHPTVFGNTLLHRLVNNGYTPMVDHLLTKEGVRVNALNAHGRTPLHLAAQQGDTSILECLLRHQETNFNIACQQGNTPLHLACMCRQDRFVLELLRSRRVNDSLKALNLRGRTPGDYLHNNRSTKRIMQ